MSASAAVAGAEEDLHVAISRRDSIMRALELAQADLAHANEAVRRARAALARARRLR